IMLAGCERTFQRSLPCGHLPIVGTGRGLDKPRLSFSLLALAPQFLALPRRQSGQRFALMPPPCGCACHCAADTAAGPNKFEGQEATPGIVAFHDGTCDEVAGHRGGVEPLATEGAGEPDAGLDLADLRHAVNGKPHLGQPEMLELHRPELRIRCAERTL